MQWQKGTTTAYHRRLEKPEQTFRMSWIMEKKMETTIVHWGDIGITTIVYNEQIT